MDGARRILAIALAAAAALVALPGTAAAAVRCEEPGTGDWREVAPAEAGMDAEKLADAISYGQRNTSFAIRVYRHGCRVGEDSAAALNRNQRFQSWSMAKSAVAIVFGRAMTLGLISPDDPLGSLVPEADEAHGQITMRQLLTMTSGLEWNGFRDYNIFMPNRLQNALTTPVARKPGTYWEYSQDGPALLAEAVARAVGEDFQAFAQSQVFGPIGIEPGDWYWDRDRAGHTQGFFGLHMTADDFGRLGELMRRGGAWQGRRLLSERFVSEALAPVPQSGCYGYLIWLNASKPCVYPRVVDRPVVDGRDLPSLPTDTFQFSGLFGQWVTVFPSQGLVVVRTGQDNGTFTGDGDWEEEMYRRMLGAITDGAVQSPPPPPDAEEVSSEDVDHGFFEAMQRPDEYSQGMNPPPLPPAGPARARATLIESPAGRLSRGEQVALELSCPLAWPDGLDARCEGVARLSGAAERRRYEFAAGRTDVLRFEMRPSFLQRLERRGRAEVIARTENRDRADGAPAELEFTIKER